MAAARASDAVRQDQAPVLLVVDYAETRLGLATLLGALLAATPGPPVVRVLLLARSAGEWWQQLIGETAVMVSDMLAAIEPVILGPLADPDEQEAVFGRAVATFTARLGIDCPTVVQMPPLAAGAAALVVHAAALLAALDHRAPSGADEPAGSPAQVISGLLGHEGRYWQQSQARYGLDLVPFVLRRVVVAGTLAGAGDEDAAIALLAAVGGLDQAARGRAALWLHDLYPAGPGGGEWIGPLRPDLVAEHLITSVLAGQHGLTRALLAGLSGLRLTRALTVLARAALTVPAATAVIRQALASDLAWLAVPALTVAVETNPAVGDLLADALEGQPWPPGLSQVIAESLPDASVALARTAGITYQALAQDPAGNSRAHAGHLADLSNWLGALGRLEDALAAIDEAVAIHRELAARPDAFPLGLAKSLNNQSNRRRTWGGRRTGWPPPKRRSRSTGSWPAPRALAQALSADGYAATASVVPARRGVTAAGEQLCQHHCPVAHVAAEYPQLCEAETEAFGRLLGTPVQRLATIAHGDGVCTTHVTAPSLRAAASGRTGGSSSRASTVPTTEVGGLTA